MKGLFPPALLGGDGLERLRAVAARLPLSAIDQPFGFEFALGREAADADFCVVAVPGGALAGHYVQRGRAASPGSPAAALGAILDAEAGGPAAFLVGKGGGVILEYDVPPSSAGAAPPPSAPPGIFLVPRDNTAAAARRLLGDPAETAAALRAAAGWPADAEELSRIRRVYEVVSGAGLIAQAGVLPGRPRRAVRLVVHRIDRAELPGLLGRLDWPGSVDAVLSVVDDAGDLIKPAAVLSLDVSASGVLPRLGIELLRRAGEPRLDPAGWRPLIDLLVEKRSCLPAKAEGLRAWTRAEPLFGLGGVFRMFQYVNHFKAVVLGGDVSVKGYAAVVLRRVEA